MVFKEFSQGIAIAGGCPHSYVLAQAAQAQAALEYNINHLVWAKPVKRRRQASVFLLLLIQFQLGAHPERSREIPFITEKTDLHRPKGIVA